MFQAFTLIYIYICSMRWVLWYSVQQGNVVVCSMVDVVCNTYIRMVCVRLTCILRGDVICMPGLQWHSHGKWCWMVLWLERCVIVVVVCLCCYLCVWNLVLCRVREAPIAQWQSTRLVSGRSVVQSCLGANLTNLCHLFSIFSFLFEYTL